MDENPEENELMKGTNDPDEEKLKLLTFVAKIIREGLGIRDKIR